MVEKVRETRNNDLEKARRPEITNSRLALAALLATLAKATAEIEQASLCIQRQSEVAILDGRFQTKKWTNAEIGASLITLGAAAACSLEAKGNWQNLATAATKSAELFGGTGRADIRHDIDKNERNLNQEKQIIRDANEGYMTAAKVVNDSNAEEARARNEVNQSWV